MTEPQTQEVSLWLLKALFFLAPFGIMMIAKILFSLGNFVGYHGARLTSQYLLCEHEHLQPAGEDEADGLCVVCNRFFKANKKSET
jgi:hypothetical protein